MLREGRTIGCFQIESPAMRALLRKIEACDVETLIQSVALVRPGASGSGMKKHFIDRHHGREPVEYLHPALERVLGETYGIMVYQEDVLKVAHAVAGMNLTEADALRRAMSKQRSPREMARSMKRFLEKAGANGVDETTAQAIWELIANFAAYSYCKAHAASYGEVAYQCAYLKAHYPAEFMAAVLSNRGGFYAPSVYLEEAKRIGLDLLPPDVNRSRYTYTAENGAIRVGLLEIRNLNLSSVEAILRARGEGTTETRGTTPINGHPERESCEREGPLGLCAPHPCPKPTPPRHPERESCEREGPLGLCAPFRTLHDFLDRTGIPASDAELLFQAGALDCFGQPRPTLLWRLRLYYEHRQHPPTLTNEITMETAESYAIPPIPDYSPKQKADLQWQALGLLISRHPLDYYLPELLELPLAASSDLPQLIGEQVTLVGWLITERRQALRDGSGVMKFMTLEDAQGTYEAVLFSEAYQAYGHLLTTLGPYLVTGKVQSDSGALAVMVEHVELAGQAPVPQGPAEFKPAG